MSSELFDIVDENDGIVGKETRVDAHRLGLWHRGAHVLLFTTDNKLLVQQRSRTKSQSPLTYDCSVSEHVTAGEDYQQAATRGLAEELGLQNISLTSLVKFKMNYGPNDNEISFIFKGIVNPEQVRFDPEEIEGVEYHTIPELQDLMQEEPERFSYWFTQILLWYLHKPSAMQIIENKI